MVLAAVAAMAVGCGDATEELTSVEVSAQLELEPTLPSIQRHVFDKSCVACHSGAAPSGNLDLSSAEQSHRALVGVPAENPVANENGWLRVKPNDPSRSFLLRKLIQPGVGEGSPMPNNQEQLTAYYLDLIERWIARGAKR